MQSIELRLKAAVLAACLMATGCAQMEIADGMFGSDDARPASPPGPVASMADPVHAALPMLAIGSEVAGDLSGGHRGKHGPAVPIGVYRFSGQQGQRICARVHSPDSYMHVYVADSLDPRSAPLFSSWLPPFTDHAFIPFNPAHGRGQGTSFMATLPRSGEYVVYVMAHQPVAVQGYSGRTMHQYQVKQPATGGGRYEIKLWDADAPEPASRLPGQARQQHPSSADAVWIGDLRHLLQQPMVDTQNAVVLRMRLQEGTLIQAQQALTSAQALPDWVYQPTGRRGEYRLALDGRTLQVQCDGSWTLGNNPASTLLFRMHGGGTPQASVNLLRVNSLGLYSRPDLAVGDLTSIGTWGVPNETNIGYALETQRYKRQDAAQAQRRRAQQAEDESRMWANALSTFAGTFSSETAKHQQQRAQSQAYVSAAQQAGQQRRDAEQARAIAARLAKQSPPPAQAAITPPPAQPAQPEAERSSGPSSSGLTLAASPSRPSTPAASTPTKSAPAPTAGTRTASPPPRPAPARPERQCRTESRTFTKKSLPESTRAQAERYVRGGLSGACPAMSQPSVGPVSCDERKEHVWGRDERGVPKVTGSRAVFVCSATISCSPVEVCTRAPGGGASAQ